MCSESACSGHTETKKNVHTSMEMVHTDMQPWAFEFPPDPQHDEHAIMQTI